MICGLRHIKTLCVLALLATCVYIFKSYTYYITTVPKKFLESLELHLNASAHHHQLRTLSYTNITCRENEEYIIQMPCRPCLPYEDKVERACLPTGNIERVKCGGGGDGDGGTSAVVACTFAVEYEAQKFWTLEGCMVGLAVLANGVVAWRRHVLEKQWQQKLQRQIAQAEL